MIEVTKYVASDGVEFYDEIDCMEHEIESMHGLVDMYAYRDGKLCSLLPEEDYDTAMNDCEIVHVYDDDGVVKLHSIEDFVGIHFKGIEAPGIYVIGEKDGEMVGE